MRFSLPSIRLTPELKQAIGIIATSYAWHFGAVALLWCFLPFDVAAIVWFLGCLASNNAIETMKNVSARRR